MRIDGTRRYSPPQAESSLCQLQLEDARVNKQPEARVSPPYDACNEEDGTPGLVVAFSSHFRDSLPCVNRAFLRDTTTNRKVRKSKMEDREREKRSGLFSNLLNGPWRDCKRVRLERTSGDGDNNVGAQLARGSRGEKEKEEKKERKGGGGGIS